MLLIGYLERFERTSFFQAGREATLVQPIQLSGIPEQQRQNVVQAGTGDLWLPLEEQRVHLPELALLPGAGRGLRSALAPRPVVQHVAKHQEYLPASNVALHDLRFDR